MNKWFKSLQTRERIALAVGVIFILILVLPFYVWKPLTTKLNFLETRIKQLEWSMVEIKYLKKNKGQINLNLQKTVDVNESLVVLIDKSLRKFNILSALQRSQPIDDNRIRIDLNNVAFNKIIQCLDELKKNHNLDVESANLSIPQSGNPGIVNASFTLITN
ncbi:MAG TPA: type II secretion system protein GspM [Woeseiaceae bacterium]|nr:type II secretion system protein GspM [Woeseiaceae bacterium]